jgi:hypothetical protein
MSVNGLFDTGTTTSVEDWKKRFSLYEDDIRNNYLFVQVLSFSLEGVAKGDLRCLEGMLKWDIWEWS